jgi:hypothetical protein
MPIRKWFPVLITCSASWLLAKDFWDQPFGKWKREDVQKMLNNSPLAMSQTFSDIRGGKMILAWAARKNCITVLRCVSSQPGRFAGVRPDDAVDEQLRRNEARAARPV